MSPFKKKTLEEGRFCEKAPSPNPLPEIRNVLKPFFLLRLRLRRKTKAKAAKKKNPSFKSFQICDLSPVFFKSGINPINL